MIFTQKDRESHLHHGVAVGHERERDTEEFLHTLLRREERRHGQTNLTGARPSKYPWPYLQMMKTLPTHRTSYTTRAGRSERKQKATLFFFLFFLPFFENIRRQGSWVQFSLCLIIVIHHTYTTYIHTDMYTYITYIHTYSIHTFMHACITLLYTIHTCNIT